MPPTFRRLFVLPVDAGRPQMTTTPRAEEHAHDHHEEVEGHRTSSKPGGAQYKVRLASSVKMIEKDDVIKR